MELSFQELQLLVEDKVTLNKFKVEVRLVGWLRLPEVSLTLAKNG